MGRIRWASLLDSGMEAGFVGNLPQFTANQAAFGVLLLAMYAKGFRLKLRTRTLGMAVAMLFAVATLIGCGAPSGDAFSGSPAGSGSGGSGSSTGTASSSTATSVNSTSVNAVTAASTSIAAGASISATVTLNAAAPAGGGGPQQQQTFVPRASPAASSAEFATQDVVAAPSAPVLNMVRPPRPRRDGTSAPISISIFPSSASLLAGASQQFIATVTGSANTAVGWTTTGGTITNTGLFTAPNVSASTIVTVDAILEAAPSVVQTALVMVTPVSPPPPPGGGAGAYSGSGPVASWKAYQYFDTDNRYHQAIEIYNAQANYPVIGYSYSDPGCTSLGDTFNDYWQPIGNGLWWFINRPALVYVTWVWYNNFTNKQILQQTPCIDYSGAPKYN